MFEVQFIVRMILKKSKHKVLPQLVYSEARRVTLFQRTPNYVLDKWNPRFGPFRRFILSFETIQCIVRFFTWVLFDVFWWAVTFK